MGEITEMILDGTLCEECCCIVYDGDPSKATEIELSPGYPRKCENCDAINEE